jgi:hypothetical protein
VQFNRGKYPNRKRRVRVGPARWIGAKNLGRAQIIVGPLPQPLVVGNRISRLHRRRVEFRRRPDAVRFGRPPPHGWPSGPTRPADGVVVEHRNCPGQSVAALLSISQADGAASICHTSGLGHPRGWYTSADGRERARRVGLHSVLNPEGGENRNRRSGINPTQHESYLRWACASAIERWGVCTIPRPVPAALGDST